MGTDNFLVATPCFELKYLVSMRPSSDHHRPDWVLVQKFLSGENQALEDLVRRHSTVLRRKLIQRGASPVEAEEIMAALWSDCVADRKGGASLLEKYGGQTPLGSWLITVATRRLIDLKRRERFTVSEAECDSEDAKAYRLLDRAAAEPEVWRDDSLLELLLKSLRAAWSRSSPDEWLILNLVHLHGLTQREVGRMWGWTESKVSRCLRQAIQHIRQETLWQVKQSDPWLELTWQDFLDLCETCRIGFL